jgi:cobalt-precorrin-5B (C1)-methyltransferase
MTLLPELPGICFIEVGDFTGAALRRAVACGVGRIVFAGMAGKLAKLAGGVLMTHYTRSKVPHDLLAEVTRAAGGTPDLAAQVEAANSARHAAELWDEAGLLPAAGTELCRRVAGVLARFCAELAAGSGPAPGTPEPMSVRVIMVDFSGRTQLAAYPSAPWPVYVPGDPA